MKRGTSLQTVTRTRHYWAAVIPVTMGVAALFGVVGIGADLPERFDAKQLVVSPDGSDGVRIREVVDQDFGSFDRHGYERRIPNDFGVPADVTASSPDASARIDEHNNGEFYRDVLDNDDPRHDYTRIRLGDPNKTITGQHRYVLEYTLPDSGLSAGVLNLDLVAPGTDAETGSFEIIVTGMTLEDPWCAFGDEDVEQPCEFVATDDGYQALIAPLEERAGVTIGGTVSGIDPGALPEVPPLPERRPSTFPVNALGLLGAGLALVAAIFALFRKIGANEVYSLGATDAAFGPRTAALDGPTQVVTDAGLDALATTEFVPPDGIRPWHGAALLYEQVDNDVVGAWFSGLIAEEVLTLEGRTLSHGPKFDTASDFDARCLKWFFRRRDTMSLAKYDPTFASAWKATRIELIAEANGRKWWKRRGLVAPDTGRENLALVLFIIGGPLILMLVIGIPTGVIDWFDPMPNALVLTLVGSGLAAWGLYRQMLRARTAEGSALALRTESFRRFLQASEGRHVEWAWTHGVLREYSAWAVALDAAEAWRAALDSARAIPADVASSVRTPILIDSRPSSFKLAHVKPSSDSSRSGRIGGSSSGGGGSVGGGGGGGSSGSW